MHITTLGIDLAKNVFQLHGVDARGRAVLSRRVKRSQLVEAVASLPPCVIGMEACGSAHHWGRAFEQLGHTVKLMHPKYVKPYVKTNKNDASRCGSDLRSGESAHHAICLDQDGGTSRPAGGAPYAIALRETPDRRHQSDSGLVGRVWVGDCAIPGEGPACPRPVSG